MSHAKTPFVLFSASLVLALAVAVPSVARAGDDTPKPAPMPAPGGDAAGGADLPRGRFFDTYDANGDGKVTMDEFSGGDAQVFELLDTNHDGVVTLAELGLPASYVPNPMKKPMDEPYPNEGRAGFAERREKRKAQLAAWDTDHDGKVTKEEYEAHKVRTPFDLQDRNKDGVLTIEDMPGPGGGEKGMPRAPMSPEEAMKQFKNADTNGDGKVTKDEFVGEAARFERLDRDHDGAITPEEMAATLREMAAGGPGGGGGKYLFQRFDKNGDGKVTRDEFSGSEERFVEMDKNGDGAITLDEALDRAKGLRGGEGGKGGKGGKGGEGGGKGGDGAKGGMGGEPGQPGMDGQPGGMAPTPPSDGGSVGGPFFAMLDKDHDGRLSRAEFPGNDDDWRRLDRNQDGWITPEEAK